MRAMIALDQGLNRIARKHQGAVRFFYEDPETFGAGHFVFYPQNDARSRLVIEEQYTSTDWSDDERVPTSWTWAAEREVRDRDGRYVWKAEREGESRSEDFRQVLAEASRWARRVQNRTVQSDPFSSATHRQEPPTLSL
jgi:hypothetical protein